MSQPNVITTGLYVALTYHIRDQHGRVLEQTDLPVHYIHGGDTELIGGMDSALVGCSAGDEIEFELTPADSGFGDHDPQLVFTDDLDNVPPQFRHVGAEVLMESDDGESRIFYVTAIADGKLTVDGNHPLAGQHLIVTVRVVEVRPPRPDDLLETAGARLH
ncbi:peptidylprolyl isomerase [Rhodopseudomonas palustris]|uniref:peptidylprolyl isomerase n=1 Tax=Thiospirillum jenense TaxID=1653858 RepID=A0A839HGW8_9GAMM|nr:peptidylprolyl isomerase [Thiospirillum jenense]MBB1091985.1 peptidylprolyl isomerase [Rhodopseudomonas palustris]MBB1126297.1 peptidylprolyl isomerase [Thiospirillum jenense]